MPQDSLRSAVYRSLVRCDDPNGVAEGETIRKSKMGSRKTERRIKWCRPGKELKSEKKKLFSEEIREEEEEEEEEMHTSAPLQLLEVSRGAEKLNQTIDSWSKGKKTINGQSKDIATDLLRGALDLQESLVMLFELQEASKNLAQMKEKSNLKSKGVDGEGIERTTSGRFVRRIYEMDLQNSRLSIGGSSMNSVEVLKKVIGESLYEQNLLSIPPSTDEKTMILDRRKWDSASDVPSTSSSQSSSATHSNNSEKATGPSVIAKLMGLEELPSEPIRFTSKLSDAEKKFTHKQRQMIDIEMPKAKNTLIVDQKVDPARKALKEIIDTMQLKGLLKSNQAEDKKRTHISHTSSHQKGRLRDGMPPIVIIKPRPTPLADRKKESFHVGRQFSPEERPRYHQLEKLRETEAREENSSKKTVIHQKVVLRLEEMLRNVEAKEEEEPRVKTLAQVKKAYNVKEKHHKLKTRDESPTQKVIVKEKVPNFLELPRKQEMKGSKITEKASPKMRNSFPQNYKPQKKEITNKKSADKMPKALQVERKPMVKDIAKSKPMSRSQDQIKPTLLKSMKPENGSIIPKNHVQCPKGMTCNPSSARNSVDRMNRRPTKAKPQKESPALRPSSKNSQCQEGTKQVNQLEIPESLPATTTISLSYKAKEDLDIAKNDVKECGKEEHSSLQELTEEINQHKKNAELAKESMQVPDLNIISEEAKTKEINPRSLFLSSPSFLHSAQNFFKLSLHQPIFVEQSININDTDMISTRLFLDRANEIMEQKSRYLTLKSHPLPWMPEMGNPRTEATLDQLVDEISEGINSLSSYLKVYDENVQPVDNLYKMLESDLKLKGMLVSNVWDLNWVNGFSIDEADQVVREVEMEVLGALIEETILDFPNKLVQSMLQCA